MALDFAALQTELFARGFTYLNDAGAGLTRAKRWINEAMHEVDESEPWDYLRTTTTGTSPITISDLGRVEYVVDVARRLVLDEMDRANLVAFYGDLTDTSTLASYWYKTSPTVIATYPVSTATLTVSYFKFGPDLSSGSDTPLMPDRFRQVIVEMAAQKAHRDNGNEAEAQACLSEAERILGRMRETLVSPQVWLPGVGVDL